MRWKLILILCIPVLLLTGVLTSLLAQSDDIILTLAIQEWQQDVYDADLFAEFAAIHPNVKVIPVFLSPNETFFGSASFDIDEYLNNAEKMANKADVLAISSYAMGVEMTRAGYLLDLTPLLTSDFDFTADDFFPPALQAFQWDGGTWALPVSVNFEVLMYDRLAFDKAGYPYPDETWTLSNFIDAANALTIRDAAGKVMLPGFYGFDERGFFRALLGRGFYDDTTLPQNPQLATPEVAAMLEEWLVFQKALFPEGGPSGNINWDAIPLTISGTWRLDNNFGPNAGGEYEFVGSLLPGGTALTNAEGFAISGGTAHPQAAYDLIKFLTAHPEVVNRFFGDSPARRSLVGVETEDEIIFRPERSPEVQAIIDQALENALPYAEIRFADYLFLARQKMEEQAIDALTALQQAEETALENLAAAEARKTTATLAVPTPIPTPILSEGEIALNFSVSAFISPLPNRDKWEALIDEFVANDPQVGQINLVSGFVSQNELLEQSDCLVSSTNIITILDSNLMLSLDPFLSADPNFDEADLLTGILPMVQRDGMTWALPLSAQTTIMWYHPEIFEKAGAFAPYNGWNVSDFEAALSQLQTYMEGGKPFMPSSGGNAYLMLLIAAYGGLPYDFVADPPTYDLTSPQNVEAIRQVLDLAKNGYMEYQELDTNSFSGGGGGGGDIPLYDGQLSIFDWRFSNRQSEDPYRAVTFPRGTDSIPMALDIGTGIISATTQHPEACYRWLSTIAQHPEVLSAMPARRSLLNSEELKVSQGEDIVALYQEFDRLLQEPGVVLFPGQFGFGGSSYMGFYLQIFMNQAFDSYVLEDGDLDAALTLAQQQMDEYKACASSIEELEMAVIADMTEEEAQVYFRQFAQCALDIQPELQERFGYLFQE
jgi:ABC-type glycerol-3-phosphate transport system substrate-binding protein